MLKSLLDLFVAPSADASLSADDERLALATLLVRVARADHQYDDDERAMIHAVLRERFQIGSAAATQLQRQAEELEENAPDTVRFTRIIKDAVPYEQRAGVVEALWRVALADGKRHMEEDGLLRLVVNLLGVSDRDSGLARQRVLLDLGG